MTTIRCATQTDFAPRARLRPRLTVSPRGIWDLLMLWQSRAQDRYRLREMDQRMLSDIGVTRQQAMDEAAKPFWEA